MPNFFYINIMPISYLNLDLTVLGVEQLRSTKTTLNNTVVQMMDELQEAELPAQRAQGHAYLLQQRVGIGVGGS